MWEKWRRPTTRSLRSPRRTERRERETGKRYNNVVLVDIWKVFEDRAGKFEDELRKSL